MNPHGIQVTESFLHVGAALVLIAIMWFAIASPGLRRFLFWTADVGAAAVIAFLFVMMTRAPAAEGHIYLSCTQGHTETKSASPDGKVTIEKKPMSYALDIDLGSRTINQSQSTVGFAAYNITPYGTAVQIQGFMAQFASFEDIHTGDYMSSIRIDRLTGLAQMSTTTSPSRACSGEWKGQGSEFCNKRETTSVYRCALATPRF